MEDDEDLSEFDKLKKEVGAAIADCKKMINVRNESVRKFGRTLDTIQMTTNITEELKRIEETLLTQVNESIRFQLKNPKVNGSTLQSKQFIAVWREP